MSAIDEGIVREYFEQNGFFVRQARKYSVTARKKTGEEEIDLLVSNPAWVRGSRAPDFFLRERAAVYPARGRFGEAVAHECVHAGDSARLAGDFRLS